MACLVWTRFHHECLYMVLCGWVGHISITVSYLYSSHMQKYCWFDFLLSQHSPVSHLDYYPAKAVT